MKDKTIKVMKDKIIKVVVAGLGPRGFNTYALYQNIHPEKMKVVAVADPDKVRLEMAQKELNLPKEKCFGSAEEMFAFEKMADVAIIATQDTQHISHACMALKKGYHILLEKPIATTLEDCLKIQETAEKHNRLVVVCHVLRYTAFYKKIKEILESKEIGDIVTINAMENVGYWHQAHSFVRGHWRNSNIESPMILAKSCHDLDIFNFLTGKKCKAISSFGSLKYFRKENMPKGATKYCYDCPYIDSCQYSAKNIYITDDPAKQKEWICYVVAPDKTNESLKKNLKNGQYGRCVFACDNNVVDHQVVNMLYEDDITCSFTMSAFSNNVYRQIRILCTEGEIDATQETNIIRVTRFGEEPVYYDINKIATDLSGHGGGDNQMLSDFCDILQNIDENGDISSSISHSMQSHIMAFKAEESRIKNGECIKIK